MLNLHQIKYDQNLHQIKYDQTFSQIALKKYFLHYCGKLVQIRYQKGTGTKMYISLLGSLIVILVFNKF